MTFSYLTWNAIRSGSLEIPLANIDRRLIAHVLAHATLAHNSRPRANCQHSSIRPIEYADKHNSAYLETDELAPIKNQWLALHYFKPKHAALKVT